MNPLAPEALAEITPARRARLLVEVFAAYVLGPLLIRMDIIPMKALHPLLLGGTIAALVVLRSERGFKRGQLANTSGFLARLPQLLRVFAICIPIIAGLMALMLFAKGQGWIVMPPEVGWFSLLRDKPYIYALVMVGYPVLSVYPQEIIYRALFFQRYAPAFGSIPAAVAANALLFGWAHVVFRNPVAIVLTVAGGVIFSITYMRTKSLLAAAFEHTLYGCLLFTIGFGWYFFGGSVHDMQKIEDSAPAWRQMFR